MPAHLWVPFSAYWSFLDRAAEEEHSAFHEEWEPAEPASLASTKQPPPEGQK